MINGIEIFKNILAIVDNSFSTEILVLVCKFVFKNRLQFLHELD